ncbi:MAG: hypothetical protein ACJA2D_002725 [Pseudohongiellaceae bacterium]|jgi:hypothetical protein
MGTDTEFDDYSDEEDTAEEVQIDLIISKQDMARHKVDIRRQIEQRLELKLMREELGIYHNLFDDSDSSSLSKLQR